MSSPTEPIRRLIGYMKIRKDIFKPYSKKHSRLESEFKVMDLSTIAKRRRELTRKNFPSEAWFIGLMNEHGISSYRRNMPIASRFFGDFVFRSLGIVIEIDGRSHVGKEDYDSRRDNFIRSLGIILLRINMGDNDAAIAAIEFLKKSGVRINFNFKAKSH